MSPHRRPPARRIVLAAHKGGAGKTTAAVNVAAAMAETGRRVLLVDVDPQGAATAAVGLQPTKPGLHELLEGQAAPDAIAASAVPGLDVLGADLDLAGAEITLPRRPGWQTRLAEVLDDAAADYDTVIIDSAPGLGVLPFIALAAADDVIVAATPSYLTLRAMAHVTGTVTQARAFRPGLRVAGVLPSIVGGRTLHRDEVLQELEKRWPGLVLPALPRRVVFEDAAAAGQPVVTFAPHSAAANAVRAVTQEVTARAQAR